MLNKFFVKICFLLLLVFVGEYNVLAMRENFDDDYNSNEFTNTNQNQDENKNENDSSSFHNEKLIEDDSDNSNYNLNPIGDDSTKSFFYEKDENQKYQFMYNQDIKDIKNIKDTYNKLKLIDNQMLNIIQQCASHISDINTNNIDDTTLEKNLIKTIDAFQQPYIPDDVYDNCDTDISSSDYNNIDDINKPDVNIANSQDIKIVQI